MVNVSEIAWVAGLFDGEGFCATGNRGRNHLLKVNMTDEELVRRVAAILGVGSVHGPITRTDVPAHWLPQWSWVACAASAVAAAEAMLPYVGSRNRERFTAMIASFRAQKLGRCEECDRTFERVHRDCRFCGVSCKCKNYRRRRKAERERLGAR